MCQAEGGGEEEEGPVCPLPPPPCPEPLLHSAALSCDDALPYPSDPSSSQASDYTFGTLNMRVHLSTPKTNGN